MQTKRALIFVLVALIIPLLTACGVGWEHGYTWRSYSRMGWLKVDVNDANLEYSGYKRLLNEMAFDKGVNALVNQKSLPDYLYVPSHNVLFLAYIKSRMIYHFQNVSAFGSSPIGYEYSRLGNSLPDNIRQEFRKYDSMYSPKINISEQRIQNIDNENIKNQESMENEQKDDTTAFANSQQRVNGRRLALVIGNSRYASSPLVNPVNDATDMSATLKRLGFDVILKKNVTHRPMEEAIKEFGNRLKKQKGVGLFFYAGHGLQVNGVNYLLPIGAKIDKETDIQFEAVNIERVLAEMANADNSLNIIMLDACRDNPFRSLFRSSSRGLAMISNAPTGTFISYSTAPNQVARDGSGRNSPYTAALLKHIQRPGLTIEDVFKSVRQRVRKETGQVPWELSSLEGKFFFIPGAAK